MCFASLEISTRALRVRQRDDKLKRDVHSYRDGAAGCFSTSPGSSWSVWAGEQKRGKEIRGPFVVTPVSVGTMLHAEEFKQLYYQETKNISGSATFK